MKLKIILLFFLFFLKLSNKIFSQDIHLSQINSNSLFQNPANTGDFKEDFRIIAGIRNQWKSITKPFRTETISFDFKLKNRKKISIGSVFLNDVSGDGIFRTNELRLIPAYYYHISKKSKILFGIDIGLNYRQLTFNKFKFGNQFDGLQFNESIPSDEWYKNQSKFNATLGIGSTYTFNTLQKMKYTLGLSLYNLNQPNQSFYNNKLKRDIRIHVSTIANQLISKRISMTHSLNIDLQGVYQEILIGSQINYSLLFTAAKPILSSGIYHRFKDAIIILIGMNYTSYYLGISYDINISQLSKASNGRGGTEICFVYSFNRKNPLPKFQIKCFDYF